MTAVLFGSVMEFYQNNGYSYVIFLANIFKSFCYSNNHEVSWSVVQQRLTTNNGFENAALKKQSWFHFSPGHGSSKCRNFSVGTLIQQKCILVLGTEQILVLNNIFLVWIRNVCLFWTRNVFQKEEWNPWERIQNLGDATGRFDLDPHLLYIVMMIMAIMAIYCLKIFLGVWFWVAW